MAEVYKITFKAGTSGAVAVKGDKADNSGQEIILEFSRTLPVAQATANILDGNVFDLAFAGSVSIFPENLDSIRVNAEILKNSELFSNIFNRINELNRVGDNGSQLTMFVRFRRDLPMDYQVVNNPDLRFLAGRDNSDKIYASRILRLSGEEEFPLYIEFQTPCVKRIEVILDKIVNKHKEFPATYQKFQVNDDFFESINNLHNWKMIHSQTILIVRNMEQHAPEKNALNGEFIGSGIAQKVSEHGVYPSMVLKFLPKPMTSEVEARIVINSLNVTQAMIQMIMESAEYDGNNVPKICYSPVEYIAVEDQEVVDDESDNPVSVEASGKSDAHFLKLPARHHSHSESEQFQEMFSVPVKGGSTLDDGVMGSAENGVSPDEEIQSEEVKHTDEPGHQTHKKRKIIWIAGIQRKYDRTQMVDYILSDPDESESIKMEIIKGILHAIDCFDIFNKRVEDFNKRIGAGEDGLLKCFLDSNFGNFVYDRENHRLIYIDVAPATSSMNGRLVPGNQLMMNWFSSREHFVSKLATDPNMSKLFLLVMVTNQLRKLEEKQCLYKGEDVSDENLNRRVAALKNVVAMIASLLVEVKGFMDWCYLTLLDFKTELNADMLEGSGREDLYTKSSASFCRYMNDELQGKDPGGLLVNLSHAEKIKLLRVLSDVVAGYMAGVKKDERELPKDNVKKNGLISKGIENKRILADFEVDKLFEAMIGGRAEHFLSDSVDVNNSVYSVVLKWLKRSGIVKDTQIVLSSVSGFKEAILTNGLTMADADSLQCENGKSVVSLPLLLKKLDDLFSRQINVLLVEPFSGDKKRVRTVYYKWDVASDSRYEIVLKEYSGVESLRNLIKLAKLDTMVLINHQVNNLYSMGDIGDFHWSSVYLGEHRPAQTLKFDSALSLDYGQEKNDVYERAIFEQIVLALKKLYISRSSNANDDKDRLILSDKGFLKRLIQWMPQDCVKWQSNGDGKKWAFIKMKLSSSHMFRFRPLLRGYSDMVRSEDRDKHCSRIYIVMYYPKAGLYVRWMLRTFIKDEQEVSYMNFRGPFSRAELKDDIISSAERTFSKLDFVFIDGGYGYSCGYFNLHKIPEITVQSGYNDDFFQKIENAHPVGGAVQETDSTDFYDDTRDDTDNLSSLELEKTFFKLDSFSSGKETAFS